MSICGCSFRSRWALWKPACVLVLFLVITRFQGCKSQEDEDEEIDWSKFADVEVIENEGVAEGSRSSSSSSSNNYRPPCRTRQRERGECRSVMRCKAAVEMIRRGRKPTVCFFDGNTPHVCCAGAKTRPQPSGGRPPQRPPITTTTTRRPRPNPPVTTPPVVTIAPRPPGEDNPPSSAIQSYDINPKGCGRRPFFSTSGVRPVVGGVEAVENSWPWMAAIRTRTSGDNSKFHCGGTVLTPRHILTAAHCFNEKNTPSSFIIIIGVHDREFTGNKDVEAGGKIVLLDSIIIHEQYVSSKHNHDIAIVKVSEDMPFSDYILPACLPNSNYRAREGSDVTITGWGDKEHGGLDSNKLLEASFPIVAHGRCQRIFQRIFQINRDMICAGDLKGNQDACQGDSGGPLVIQEPDANRWLQVGIVSFGVGCAERGFPGVYTRVASYVTWVRSTIRAN